MSNSCPPGFSKFLCAGLVAGEHGNVGGNDLPGGLSPMAMEAAPGSLYVEDRLVRQHYPHLNHAMQRDAIAPRLQYPRSW